MLGTMSQNFGGIFDPLPGVFRTWDHHHCLTKQILQISKKNWPGSPLTGGTLPPFSRNMREVQLEPHKPQVVIRYTFLQVPLQLHLPLASQNHKISKFQNLKISKLQNFKDFQIFRFSDFQIFRFSDFHIFRFSDFQIFRFLKIFTSLTFSDFQIFRFLKIEVSDFHRFSALHALRCCCNVRFLSRAVTHWLTNWLTD